MAINAVEELESTWRCRRSVPGILCDAAWRVGWSDWVGSGWVAGSRGAEAAGVTKRWQPGRVRSNDMEAITR